MEPTGGLTTAQVGSLHHVEWQVHDLPAAITAWGWLLGELGYRVYQEWDSGMSWRLGSTYLVIARARRDHPHDRRGAGLSHLALHAGSRSDVDRLWSEAPAHGWRGLYPGTHPFAGGAEHYAAFLEDLERFKVELVAQP